MDSGSNERKGSIYSPLYSSSEVWRLRSYLNNPSQKCCGCHYTQGSVVGCEEEGVREVLFEESSQDQVATVEWVQTQDINHQSAHKKEGTYEKDFQAEGEVLSPGKLKLMTKSRHELMLFLSLI